MSTPVNSSKLLFISLEVLIPLFAFILIVLPCICKWEIDDHSQSTLGIFPVDLAISSTKFEVVLNCGISVVIQMFITLLLRIISNPSIVYSYKSGSSFLINFIIMLAPQLIIRLVIIPLNSIELLIVVIESQNVFILSFVASFLNFHDKLVWRGLLFKFSCFLLVLSSVLTSYRVYASQQLLNSVQVGIMCSQIFGGFVFFLLSLKYFLTIFKSYRLNSLTLDQCLCSNFVFFYSLLLFAKIIHSIQNHYQSILYYNVDNLVSYFYLIALFYFFTNLIQSHLLLQYSISTKSTLEIKRTFIRYMSHEIRTPLNTVMMGLQYLQELYTSANHKDEDTLNVIEDIIVSCSVATKTLNDLLMYDTVETGKLSIRKVAVNLSSLIEETIKMFYVEATKKGITLTATYYDNNSNKSTDCNDYANTSSNIIVNVDPSRITQALHNLLANAMAHTPTNGSITFKVKKLKETSTNNAVGSYKNEIVKIDIIDTGSGISLERQSGLFCGAIDFTPGLIQDISSGAGLGLYITKGIIDAHQGVLSMYSEGLNKGCTFTIALPLNTKQDLEANMISSGGLAKTSNISGVGESVTIEGQRQPGLLTRMSDSVHKSFLRVTSVSDSMNDEEMEKSNDNISNIYTSQINSKNNRCCYYPGNATPSTRLSCISTERSSIIEITDSSSDRYLLSSPYCFEEEKESHNEEGEQVYREEDNSIINNLEHSQLSITAETNINHEFEKLLAKKLQVELKSDDSTAAMMYYNKNRLRVLVVDDVALNRKMLLRLLKSRCEMTVEAVDGLDAINQVRQAMSQRSCNFDVITIDYQMPVMDGPTAVKKIREMGFKGCILGVTGNALPEDVTTFLEHGVDEVLRKPLDILLFDKAVLSCIKQRNTK